ncbi:glycoside hydrolase family 5 protein [Sphingomonas cannabina]|uniref:glycoside hydrolase family 5 protein n=1 Tax=Sphingomonas cannabina TaxID=2899123 RepID=UPI001F3F1B2C|nr:cellulase family glycosylhydrolase [Sphingomonas cannabina]UIJ43986.1 glycoside hydrolase family 5 protein [Sphingomonas cannabina]
MKNSDTDYQILADGGFDNGVHDDSSHIPLLRELDPVNRRRAIRWLVAGAGAIVAGCGGGGSSAETGGSIITPTPSPTPTPTPAPTPAPTPTPTPTPAPSGQDFRYGVNFASLEGTPDTLPGRLNGEVFVTPDSHFSYYKSKGMDHIRLQGAWERLQPRTFGELGEQLLDHYADPNNPLRNTVNLVRHYLDRAQANGLKVFLDLCHNYGSRWVGYNGSWSAKSKAQLGSSQVPISAFVDYCTKLVQTFGSHPAVVGIELMNEPHDLAIGEAGWRDACQQSINAIRKINSSLWILIDGYGWASAQMWPQNNPTIHTLSDPANRIMWSAHQYFDANSSGVYGGGSESAPTNANIGVQRLAPFIEWLKAHGFQDRGHIGEFGAPDRTEWQTIVRNFVQSADAAGLRLTAHQDIPYLNDTYTMNLFPQTDSSGKIVGADRGVMQVLQQVAQ